MESTNTQEAKRIIRRRRGDRTLHLVFLVCTSIGIVALSALIISILMDGLHRMSPELFTNYPSRIAERAGLKSPIVGTIYLLLLMAPISFILGVGAAIFLEEYAGKRRWVRLIQLNISTLAGVPSIIYGILGLAIFVRGMNMGRSLLAGVLTMTLLVLPIIIVSSQEALRAVPKNRRDGSYALGATKWQTVSRSVLPSAMPGIMTGVILALSRAVGETAPLIMIGALTYVAFLPENLLDSFTVMPIQIFNWISRPSQDFHDLAASGIILLLILLFLMNLSAIWIRNKFQKNT